VRRNSGSTELQKLDKKILKRSGEDRRAKIENLQS